ncbi:hypothetical protein [Brevibacillus panacihumi]|uniref:hypothetical protein n=1 Tax=Brevibacillus panacihumi TaxID=497735 RepID=UPI003D1F3821
MTSKNLSFTPEDIQNIQEMCDDNIPLYKIAATFDSYNGRLLSEFIQEEGEEVLQALINRLNRVDLPPNDAFISDGVIGAHWYPPFPFFFDDPNDLINLMSNFQCYLDTLDFTKGTIDADTWIDQANSLKTEEKLYQKLLGVSIKSKQLGINQIKECLGDNGMKVWRSILVYDFRSSKNNRGSLFRNFYY